MSSIKKLLQKIEAMTLEEFNSVMVKFFERYDKTRYFNDMLNQAKEHSDWTSFFNHPQIGSPEYQEFLNEMNEKSKSSKWSKYWMAFYPNKKDLDDPDTNYWHSDNDWNPESWNYMKDDE